jgi:hypothetical protein
MEALDTNRIRADGILLARLQGQAVRRGIEAKRRKQPGPQVTPAENPFVFCPRQSPIRFLEKSLESDRLRL